MKSEWAPIGADYRHGLWRVLWAKRTDAGWQFRMGEVGLTHIDGGTPGGIRTDDG